MIRLAPAAFTIVALASGWASKYAKVEESFAQPVNCSTAQMDIQTLEEDKAGKSAEASAATGSARPAR